MSIPERLYRIARYKLGEIKDRLEKLDEEAEENYEAEQKRRQSEYRSDARRELKDSLDDPTSNMTAPRPANTPTTSATPPRRTPEQIANGQSASPANSAFANTGTTLPDPLDYHYKLLGVETGSDFATVQSAYNRLAARCEPSRFPAGSQEAQESQTIRERLEASYKILRDALDPTARRFDLLEFDSPGASS